MTLALGHRAWERYRDHMVGNVKAPRRSLRRREFLEGFDRGAVLAVDAALIGAVLGPKLSPREIANWFDTPNPNLAGETPLEALARGEVRHAEHAARQQ